MQRDPDTIGGRPLRVTFVVADLGLGGTGKGVVSFSSRLDRTRFSPKVVTLAEGGPREADLRAASIPYVVAPGERLAEELGDADIVHVFRHGIADPTIPAAADRAGVRTLIETNIFGARDRSADEPRFACHLFVSMMCLMRYRAGLERPVDGSVFDERHRVLYFPPEVEALRSAAPSREAACRALGLDPGRPVIARLGRAADLKWRDLLVDMVPFLLRLVPEVQILFVGATEAKQTRLARRGLTGRVRLVEPVAELDVLATLYAASDVVLNASMIGESQGLVIAEALGLGIPVVTCSTPWADNAQVEFVRNGETGWVANHPREFAEAVADLLLHPERRRAFGAAGRALVDRVLDPDALARQLEQLYAHHVRGGTVEWAPTTGEVARFAAGYAERADASFRALSVRERVEARATRERELLTRRLASARMLAATLLGRIAQRGRHS